MFTLLLPCFCSSCCVLMQLDVFCLFVFAKEGRFQETRFKHLCTLEKEKERIGNDAARKFKRDKRQAAKARERGFLKREIQAVRLRTIVHGERHRTFA